MKYPRISRGQKALIKPEDGSPPFIVHHWWAGWLNSNGEGPCMSSKTLRGALWNLIRLTQRKQWHWCGPVSDEAIKRAYQQAIKDGAIVEL